VNWKIKNSFIEIKFVFVWLIVAQAAIVPESEPHFYTSPSAHNRETDVAIYCSSKFSSSIYQNDASFDIGCCSFKLIFK
jgi:hypothetical protein